MPVWRGIVAGTVTTHYTEHAAQGVERLIERYRKPRTSALLESWLTEVQALEDVLYDLLVLRGVAVATGATLDILGRIVGEPRDGRDDDTYRLWIAARILVSLSSGTPPQLLAIVQKLVGGAAVVLTEYYPAAFDISVDGIPIDDGWQIAALIHAAKPAGVRAFFSWTGEGTAGSIFTFAPADVAVPDSPLGFDAGSWAYVTDGTIPVPLPGFEFDDAGSGGFDGAIMG